MPNSDEARGLLAEVITRLTQRNYYSGSTRGHQTRKFNNFQWNQQTTNRVLDWIWTLSDCALPAARATPPQVSRRARAAKRRFTMTTGRIARIALFASLAVLLSAFLASSGSRPAGNAQPHPHQSGCDCKSVAVGGSIITNFGAVDPNTTLGPAKVV